jgi:hypothetical protein
MYVIKNWDSTFENSRSREIKTCSYVCVPNKQHGMGFLHIITQPDGPAIIGAWYLILEACSMQHAPRWGYLTDTGTAEGRQWDGRTLALRFRRSEEEFNRALEVLCSQEVGWMENTERQNVGRTSAEQSHILPSEGKGIEGKGIEGKGTSSVGSSVEQPTPPKAISQVKRITWDGKDFCGILQEDADLWSKAYPAVNVVQEISRAEAWLQANPKKTKSNYARFLTNWFARSQEKGGTR